jgi:predicted metal-binding protein
MTKRRDLVVVDAAWDSLLLVCKDCRRRKNGPKHVKAKPLAKVLKRDVRKKLPKARIVLTSCLDLCPKRATTVAFVGAGGEPRIAAIKSIGQLDDFLRLLRGPMDDR